MVEYRTAAAGNSVNRKGRFLLVVDSDQAHLSFMSLLLQRFGYKTFTAATAKEALALTAVTVPSLITAAADLADMSGIELMQRLKEDTATEGVPLIAMRKQDDVIGEEQCFKQGVIDCLSKPVSIEELYRVVQEVLETTPRAHIRIKTLLPVQSAEAVHDCFNEACATDLSEGGMFVRTKNPAAVHTSLSCRLHVYEQTIPMDTIVLYRRHEDGRPFLEPGMGLRFSKIASSDRDVIRRFVRNEITRGLPSAHA